jgi:hypothetical protein
MSNRMVSTVSAQHGRIWWLIETRPPWGTVLNHRIAARSWSAKKNEAGAQGDSSLVTCAVRKDTLKRSGGRLGALVVAAFVDRGSGGCQMVAAANASPGAPAR